MPANYRNRTFRFPVRERRRLRYHAFSSEIKCELRKLSLPDNRHGPLALAEDIAIIGSAIAIGTAIPLVAPLAVFTIGSRMRALATLLHEATHRTLAQNQMLNHGIGMIAGYSIFQTFESYKKSHVKDHHHYTGNPDLDPDLKFHLGAGLYDRLTLHQFVWRHIAKPGLALTIGKTLKYLFQNRLVAVFQKDASPKERTDGMMFVGFWSAVAVALTVTGLWPPFLLWWILPYLTTFQMVNYFCELGEHFPEPAITDLDIEMSHNRLGSVLERFFFGMHNEHLHLEHHLAPGIPFWNLPKARDARLKDPTYAIVDARMGGLFTRGPRGGPSIMSRIITWVASNAATI